jgi:hypothetical protein
MSKNLIFLKMTFARSYKGAFSSAVSATGKKSIGFSRAGSNPARRDSTLKMGMTADIVR